MSPTRQAYLAGLLLLAVATPLWGAEEWRQLKFDARRSGNAAERSLASALGLLAAAPLSDAVGSVRLRRAAVPDHQRLRIAGLHGGDRTVANSE